MQDIRIAAGQFETRDADAGYNLQRIDELTRQAVENDARLVSFHECCVCGYTFMMGHSREALVGLAESVPDGPSTRRLIEIAGKYGVAVGAGFLERDGEKIYNTYVVVTGDGLLAKHRKLHAFVNPHLSSGDSYTIFEYAGCRFGVLICYDNNLPENARITTMMGAEVLLAPHVTCGTESPMPGRGKIPREVWENRETDPVRCRLEFLGPKGRAWLMRWLPARAFENGIYIVFTNPVGVDHDTIKNGNAMILDPYGEVLVESNALGDDVVVGLLTAEKLSLSSGRRYVRARRPELYGKLVEATPDGGVTEPGWKLEQPPDVTEKTK